MQGLVLEGGGARGAYEIGACKALFEEGLEFTGITGTSVGALNGAMLAQGNLERAWEMWYGINPARVFRVNDQRMEELLQMERSMQSLSAYMGAIRRIVSQGGLDVTPLQQMLDELIDEARLRRSGIDFGLVTISLTDFKPLEIFVDEIPEGQVVGYLMASASLPVFKLDRMQGKRFIDGGFHDNVPIRLLKSRGYRDIMVIRTFAPGFQQRVKSEGLNLRYIYPVEDLGPVLRFDQELARRNLQLGYYDALRESRRLKGRKYYIKPMRESSVFYDYLMHLDEELVVNIGQLMGFEGMPYRRMLFEQIIPHLCDLMGISKEADYEDIAVLLLEEIADKYEVERFRLYSFREFLTETARLYTPHRSRILKELPAFLQQSHLVHRLVRSELLDEIVFQLYENFWSGEKTLQ